MMDEQKKSYSQLIQEREWVEVFKRMKLYDVFHKSKHSGIDISFENFPNVGVTPEDYTDVYFTDFISRQGSESVFERDNFRMSYKISRKWHIIRLQDMDSDRLAIKVVFRDGNGR
jgi:hypothetical protein